MTAKVRYVYGQRSDRQLFSLHAARHAAALIRPTFAPAIPSNWPSTVCAPFLYA